MALKEVSISDLQLNPFTAIGKEWTLITAGTLKKANTMTASWGEMGVLWQRNVLTIFIRPSRYTKEFVDANETFTVSVLKEGYREALNYCGTVTGRGINKIGESGLTLVQTGDSVAFEEARLVFVCKKIYEYWLDPESFIIKDDIDTFYPKKDFHRVYVGEIQKVFM
ncbi:MAG: flavin reductase family protein [Lachnospiraceae bacterium]|jgi:flavin reductase (DIM6/NTAB) family NADH-FMN oxidoreductase RutF|nr:flavin reductase family protein [Lachnospiraceae bacterium]